MRAAERLTKLTSGIAAGAVVLLLVAVPVRAQSSDKVERISISPASKTATIDAGKSASGTFDVINSGDTDFEFRIYAQPYGVKGEGYAPEFTGSFPNSDAYKWVALQTTGGSLKPGEKKQIDYSLIVPTGAAPGGHYGVIFAETKAKDIGTTGLARQKRVGQVLFVTVNGSFIKSGEVAGFTLPFWQGKPPFKSSVRIKNTGNVDLQTKATTVATDLFGRKKFSYTGDGAVLRETTRRIDMDWKGAPVFGFYRVTQNAQFLGQNHVHKGFVLMAPRWFPILVVLIIGLGVGYAVVSRRKAKK